MKLAAVDRWVIGYAAAASLAALLFAPDQGPFLKSHLLHAGAIAVSLAVAYWLPTKGRLLPFLRYGYPVLLFGLFYSDTGPYVFLLFSEWFDPALIRWESALVGFNVPEAVAGIQSVWLLELFMFGYLFYYLMLPVAFVVAFSRKEPDVYRRLMTATCAVFVVSFSMFALYPLEGPRYALASVLPPIQGGPFFGLVMAIQNSGSIHGGCMPSSHTAVAWTVTYYVHKMHRTWGWILVVISTLLSMGCFWGRFHYVTDVAVGLLIFAAAVLLTEWLHRRRISRDPDRARVGRQEVPCTR